MTDCEPGCRVGVIDSSKRNRITAHIVSQDDRPRAQEHLADDRAGIGQAQSDGFEPPLLEVLCGKQAWRDVQRTRHSLQHGDEGKLTKSGEISARISKDYSI